MKVFVKRKILYIETILRAYTHMGMHTQTCTHTHTHTHTHIHIHTHTCNCTHEHSDWTRLTLCCLKYLPVCSQTFISTPLPWSPLLTGTASSETLPGPSLFTHFQTFSPCLPLTRLPGPSLFTDLKLTRTIQSQCYYKTQLTRSIQT